MQKYELTDEAKELNGKVLHRIRALIDLDYVKAGDVGGWIESESNLDQTGNAWVSSNACVKDNARVSGNAWVSGNACVSGNAWVSRDAKVSKPCHVMTVGGIGAKNETLTFYRAEGEKIVVCGTCFLCTVDELEDRVRVMYGNSKHARAYALARELAKVQIEDVIIDA